MEAMFVCCSLLLTERVANRRRNGDERKQPHGPVDFLTTGFYTPINAAECI